MGIYIKGMEMPTSCCECPVNIYLCNRGYKHLLADPEPYDKRADGCPLVPVPPHGRLIDLDAIPQSAWRGEKTDLVDELILAPTIFPAEPAEEVE